jgi:hypothetical protein
MLVGVRRPPLPPRGEVNPVAVLAATAYACGAFLWAVGWGVSWDDAHHPRDRAKIRTAARMLLLTPIWPAVAVLMAGIWVVQLWHEADWGNLEP